LFNLFKDLGYGQTLEKVKNLTSGSNQIQLSHFSAPLQYELSVSARRKTLAIEIKQSRVFVKAPAYLSHNDIESFLIQKQDWVKRKLAGQQSLPKNQMFYRDGDNFLLFGDNYLLSLENGHTFQQTLNHEKQTLTFVVPTSVKNREKYVKNKLSAFFKKLAQDYVLPRAEELALRTGLIPSAVEIKFYRTRWGCCYHNGLIRINPWLMAAPKSVIDCVVIHELCHLKHLNHSKAFWTLNKEHCGSCKKTDIWLRKYGHVAMMA